MHDDDCDDDTAFLAYVEYVGREYATRSDFEDNYVGEYDDREAWAWEYLDSSGMLDELPEWARVHSRGLVDSWCRDAFLGGDFWDAPNPAGGVFVFWAA